MRQSALRLVVRTVLRVLADAGCPGLLVLRLCAHMAAESLILRKQLALYLERQVKRRRADDACRSPKCRSGSQLWESAPPSRFKPAITRAGYFARPHDFQSISACRRGRRIVVVSPAAVKDQRRIQGLRRASGAGDR